MNTLQSKHSPSEFLSRNITAARTETIVRMPLGWPLGAIGAKQQITVVPPTEIQSGKRYRVDIDLLALIATIREVRA